MKVGRWICWAYCGFFGLGGVALAVQGQLLSGSLMASSAMLAFPPLANFLPSRLHGKLLNWSRAVSAVVLFVAASATMNNPPRTTVSNVSEPAFVPSARGIAVAKLLLVDDFAGYVEGRKVVADWSGTYPIDVRSTAPALFAKYHANEVAADEQFKDKRIAISGQISSINKDVFSTVYLVLRDSNPFEGVHAELSSSSEKFAAAFSRGQDVTLVCTGSGMVIGSPILKKCDLLPVIVEENGQRIGAMTDELFAGEEGQPEIVRTMIGLGYAMGASMPAGDACDRAKPGNMAECIQLMKSAPKGRVDAQYQALSSRFHLGPRPMPK
jgi:hypothetical protein